MLLMLLLAGQPLVTECKADLACSHLHTCGRLYGFLNRAWHLTSAGLQPSCLMQLANVFAGTKITGFCP